jgi:hypothetical protein
MLILGLFPILSLSACSRLVFSQNENVEVKGVTFEGCSSGSASGGAIAVVQMAPICAIADCFFSEVLF